MHTITLNVKDSIYDKIIYFLKHLPKNEIEITQNKKVQKRDRAFNSISLNTKGFKFNREEANAR